MDIKDELSDINFDDIMSEFHSDGDNTLTNSTEVLNDILKELDLEPEVQEGPSVQEILSDVVPADEGLPAAEATIEEAESQPEVPTSENAEQPSEAEQIILPELNEQNEQKEEAPANQEPVLDPPPAEPKPPVPDDPRSKLLQLKKKLIAGPEKLYYDLSEVGVTKLQIGLLVNLVIVALCAGGAVLYSMDMVPENRMKFLIFSQLLAMMVSGLLGCYLMLDGLGELLHARFTVNTMLAVTFLACLADGVLCLQELRVPCCAAFCLEMQMAMLARYHKRITEMGELDTMRKAAHLVSIVKIPDYYEGKPGILRGEGDVEDFMDTYSRPTGPEKAQNLYCILSLILCIGIAAIAYILHSPSMGIQIFAVSLLVALPASFFITLTRPASILEKRLHMVGAVLCGWQGVKKLCGKVYFPLSDNDLFPGGSTKLNGVKFYSSRNPDEIVEYTASIVNAAGGGLLRVFTNLLNSRDGSLHAVMNFRDYGIGGVGGEIKGEPVLVGTLDFLQDCGITIPEGTKVNQAVYTAIDGELCAVYAITYSKMTSATAGLVSLCGNRRVKPLLTAMDFLLTEDFLHEKFGINTRKLTIPEREKRSVLSKQMADPEADVLAMTIRTDLVASAYAVCGAGALRRASRVGLFIHILGGLVGMAMMLVLAYLGSDELLTPINVMLYQLIWLIPGWLATEWTRHV